jgi:hypothetical protein
MDAVAIDTHHLLDCGGPEAGSHEQLQERHDGQLVLA